jgi:hypothetical protein
MARFDQPIELMALGTHASSGAAARRVVLELPAPSGAERRSVDDVPLPTFGPADGVHKLPDHRCRRPAELAGAAAAGDANGMQCRS